MYELFDQDKLTVPFDKDIIKALRAVADAHVDDPYGSVNFNLNWLWWNRMVATMEKSLEKPNATTV